MSESMAQVYLKCNRTPLSLALSCTILGIRGPVFVQCSEERTTARRVKYNVTAKVQFFAQLTGKPTTFGQ